MGCDKPEAVCRRGTRICTDTCPHDAGLLSVSDNGVGMTKQELNSWAVMNLSMEDRGLKPLEADGNPGLGRFLSGNLSYFGVRAGPQVHASADHTVFEGL